MDDGTYHLVVSYFTLRGLSVPVNLYLVSTVSNILITTLVITKPGS